MSRKRTVDCDGRMFQERREGLHVCASRRETGLSLCYDDNLHLHFDTKHGAQSAKVNFHKKQQSSVVQELKVFNKVNVIPYFYVVTRIV